MVREPVEREGEHQLAGPRRPAERLLGVAHALARADHPPEHVAQAAARPPSPPRRSGVARRPGRGSAPARRPARAHSCPAAARPSASSPSARAPPAPSPPRNFSPAANCRSLTSPRDLSQPSGDSARLTVTDRAGRLRLPVLPSGRAVPRQAAAPQQPVLHLDPPPNHVPRHLAISAECRKMK